MADTSSTSVTNAGALGKVTYGHIENNALVTDATMTYTYTNEASDGVYRLSSAKDETSGTEIRYTYDAVGRVQTVSEYANNTKGQSISFEYGTDYTEVRTSGQNDVLQDDDDIITRHMLDYQGRTVGIYSTYVTGTTLYGASNGVYEDDNSNDNSKNSLKSSAVTNSVAVNYIQNGGFDYDTTGWYGTANSTVINSYDIGFNYYNYLSVPVTASQVKGIYQYVTLPNGTYTLSALVNGTANAHATINLQVENTDTGERICEGKYDLVTDQYSQNCHTPTVTFTVDEEETSSKKFKIIIQIVGSASSNGSVLIDNVMLEKSIGAGTFNMLQYSGFDETTVNANGIQQNLVETYWETDQTTAVSYTTGGIDGSNALRMEGDVNQNRIVSQTIPMEVTWNTSYFVMSRTFTVSGFAKGSHQVANEDACFAFDVYVNYTDGTKDYWVYEFNKELEDWQFLSRTFTTQANKLIASIDVICVYAFEPGTAYFDNISLIEETGNNAARYAYTENGLLEFKYTPSMSEYYVYDANNNLTTVYNSHGKGTAYVYDSNNTLLSETTFKYTISNDTNLNWWYLFRRENGATWGPDTTAISKTEYTINQYGLNTQTVSYAASGNKDDATQVSSTKQLVSSSTYQLTTGSTLFGKVLSTTDTSGNTVAYTYNTKGQLTHERRADNNGLYYEYDTLGRMTNVYPLMYYMSIDLLYYPFVVTTEEKAVYTYNPDHSLSTISTTSTVYSFVYDDFGNTTAIMVGEGDTAVALATYQYAPHNGKLMSMTYGNGKVMTYTYDALDRVSEIC